MRIGLVLGAGGAVGHAFHAGVLAALADATGWDARDAEVIVGTSAGSLVGAFLRAGALGARPRGAPDRRARCRTKVGALVDRADAATEHLAADPVAPAAAARRAGDVGAGRARCAPRSRPWNARPGAVAAAALPGGPHLDRDHRGRAAAVLRRLADRAALDQRRRPATRAGASPSAATARRPPTSPTRSRRRARSPRSSRRCRSTACATSTAVCTRRPTPTSSPALGLDLVVISSPMSIAGRLRSVRGRSAGASARALRARARGRAASAARGTPVLTFQPTAADLAVMGLNAMDPSRARRRHAPGVRSRRAIDSARADAGDRVDAAQALAASASLSSSVIPGLDPLHSTAMSGAVS